MDNPLDAGDDFVLPEDEMKLEYQESVKYNPFVELAEQTPHFKNLGFWCAMTYSTDPGKAFRELLESHFSLFRRRKNDLEAMHIYDRNRFLERIGEVTAQIRALNSKISDQANEIPEFEGKIAGIEAEIIRLQRELATAYKTLGEAKKTLLDKQIEITFEELNALNEKYREISEKHGAMNAEAKARNPDAFEFKPTLLADLEASYREVYDKVQDKAAKVGLNGNWLTNPWYLRIIGLLTAYASGYFFSIFASQQSLGTGGITFFIVTGLFTFFSGLIGSSQWLGYAIAAAIMLVLPFFFLLVSYVCGRLLERHELRLAERADDLKIILDSDNKIQISEIANVNDFYSFFLKKMPFGIVVAFIFILVAFGYAGATDTSGTATVLSTRLASLAASLSGFLVGGNLSLGLAGMIYIYLIYVINPRLERQRSADPQGPEPNRNEMRTNFELVAVLIGVLGLALALLIGLQKGFLFANMPALGNKTAFVSLLFFIITAAITAFVFGYGMYFSGIIETQEGIERRLLQINRQHAFNMFPSIKIALLADRMFGKQYIDIVNKLLNRVAEKVDFSSKNKDTSKPPPQASPGYYYFLPKGIRRMIESRKTDKDRLNERLETLNGPPDLPPEDEKNFPEITSEINNLDGQVKENKKRLLIIEAEIASRKQENSEYVRRLNATEKTLQDRVREWRKHISFLNREQFKEIERFNRKYESEVSDLSDGFNLAVWFLGSGGDPAKLKNEDKPE